MTRHLLMAVTMILFAAGFGIAAQESAVDGRWQGTSETADGAVTITYTFHVKGQAVTGTEESPIVSRSISEGKVDGDKISFKTTVNGNSIEHEGTISGNTIQLKSHGPYGEFDMKLGRVSEKK